MNTLSYRRISDRFQIHNPKHYQAEKLSKCRWSLNNKKCPHRETKNSLLVKTSWLIFESKNKTENPRYEQIIPIIFRLADFVLVERPLDLPFFHFLLARLAHYALGSYDAAYLERACILLWRCRIRSLSNCASTCSTARSHSFTFQISMRDDNIIFCFVVEWLFLYHALLFF